MKKMIAAFLLIAFASISFAQANAPIIPDIFEDRARTAGGLLESLDPTATCGDNWFGQPARPTFSQRIGATVFGSTWLPLILGVTALVIMAAILMYLFGNFLQSPNLTNTAKEMLNETAITILRLGFIIGMLQAGQTWYVYQNTQTPSLVSDPVLEAPTMIDGSIVFSKQMVYDMSQSYSLLLIYNSIIHTLFSATMWFGVTWRAMYSFNLGPVLKPLIDLIGFVMQFLSVAIGEWIIHFATLCIIKKWTWSLIVPFGIVLRAIPPLRGAGDAILALIFSLAIVYPLMFIISYETNYLLSSTLAIDVTSQGRIVQNFVNDLGIGGLALATVAILFLSAGVFVPLFLEAGLAIAFDLVRTAIYYTIIMGLLLPFVNIFITLTSARETARFFNVDINFMSFAKLI